MTTREFGVILLYFFKKGSKKDQPLAPVNGANENNSLPLATNIYQLPRSSLKQELHPVFSCSKCQDKPAPVTVFCSCKNGIHYIHVDKPSGYRQNNNSVIPQAIFMAPENRRFPNVPGR